MNFNLKCNLSNLTYIFIFLLVAIFVLFCMKNMGEGIGNNHFSLSKNN
jgi:hypothetical protein